jgi:hypothetical protein
MGKKITIFCSIALALYLSLLIILPYTEYRKSTEAPHPHTLTAAANSAQAEPQPPLWLKPARLFTQGTFLPGAGLAFVLLLPIAMVVTYRRKFQR